MAALLTILCGNISFSPIPDHLQISYGSSPYTSPEEKTDKTKGTT